MSNVVAGVLLALIAGVVNGSFAVPTKYMPLWKWENTWALWAVVAFFVTPWILAFATVPRLFDFYRATDPGILLLLAVFGLGVGLSQVFFGLALAAVGLSIGFAVTIGLSTAIGSLVPFIVLQPSALFTSRGLAVLAGVASILIGTALCGVASNHKEKERRAVEARNRQGGETAKKVRAGLLLCILSGLLAPLSNFALAFGASLAHRAASLGVGQTHQTNVIWPPLLTATLVPFLAYCFYLWRRNRSWALYSVPGTKRYWIFGVVMGVLWTGSLVFYGSASTHLAAMGPILGWPLFMSVVIMTSNGWGFLTREWKGVSRGPVGFVLTGLLFLIVGFCSIALASKVA